MTSSHFGNPLSEQRELASGNAFVTRSDQCVLSVTGEDRQSWLHSLVSQDVINLKSGDSAEALLLSPQGHIEHQLKLVIKEDQVLIITPRERSAALADWLGKMRFRAKVEIAESDLGVYGHFGKGDWQDPFSLQSENSVSYNPQRAVFGYAETLGTPPLDQEVGLLAYQALRIAAGRPEISDLDEKSLPHEFDWLSSAVHLSKGCYRGQESVAKVHNLGHPPRRLTLLHLESGDSLPEVGTEVYYLEKLAGKIVASALHFEMGGIALALLSRATPYLDLAIAKPGGSLASQQVLVPADAGKAANLPRPSAFKLSSKR